jgi:hypothetical protein
VLLAAAVIIKACALLTAADVASVQGEKPAKARESARGRDSSQCIMALPSAAKSVSLEVIRGPRAVQFADRLRVAAEVEGDEAGEDEQPAVERVLGVGDEAFWAGPQAGLYVLRGKVLLRIAIAGKEGKEATLAKLRLLAERAISHLPR